MLKDKVEKILKELPQDEEYPNNEALRKAERLADKYQDIKPKTYSVPMERYAGLPYIQSEKNACY